MRQDRWTSEEVQRLIAFIEGSQRGISGGVRRSERATLEDEEIDEHA
jgi:hypothetical protein